MNDQFGADDETFWEKYRGAIVVALLVLAIGGFIALQLGSKKTPAPVRTQNFTMVTLPPPPPKPIPTPPPQATPPPVDQKMDEPRPMEPQEAVKPDEALDSVIESQVLNGLQLDSPPPAGMPLPIVLRLTARKSI